MRRVIPGLKRLPTLRPETLAALLAFILVLMINVVHVFLHWFNVLDNDASDNAYWPTVLVLAGVNVALPIVVYIGVKVYLAPPPSPFPDIDIAFEAGLEALRKNGIALGATPIYLVLGMSDAKAARQMMTASGRTFDLSHVTADGQALHWYGSAESTYVFLTGVGNVCQLSKDLGKHVRQSPGGPDAGGGGDFKGTIDVRALGNPKQAIQRALDPPSAGSIPKSDRSFKATIKADELRENTGRPTSPTRTKRSRSPKPKQLSSREKLATQKRRLVHFCELLARRRQPVCGLNGIIVSMDNRLVEEFPGELARQIKSDLSTVCQTTGVISTVNAVVTGFEDDEGCREFVARLKETKGDDIATRRFGKSYRSWECPTADHLKEISNESIENFDQYIYSIFTQHDALSSRHVNGNRDMVKFLCWIYARFFEGLEHTLTNGFNTDSSFDEDYPRFAGCYFMGIGERDDRQFFNAGVFDRVDENQGELEWTSRVLEREEHLSFASQLLFLAGLITIAIFILLVILTSYGYV